MVGGSSVGSSLLLPTLVMGMTTPVLIAATVRRQRETAANAGLLYGMNTFGAAVGSLVRVVLQSVRECPSCDLIHL